MIKIAKTLYLKELREGYRLVGLLIILTLFILCNYFNTFIFLSFIIIFPSKFLNIIWSNKDEFLFFYLNSKKSIREVIISRKVSVFLELNILLYLSFYVFDDFFNISFVLILNIFILTYFVISDLLFYYSFYKYTLQNIVNFFNINSIWSDDTIFDFIRK